jgi:hypothetical protein
MPGEPMRRTLERGMASYAFEPVRWSRSVEAGLADRKAHVLSVVLAAPPANAVPDASDEAAFVRALVADPAYQLR